VSEAERLFNENDHGELRHYAVGLEFAVESLRIALSAKETELDKAQTENAALLRDKERLEGVVEAFVETINVPEANCSCHVAAPCSDCVEYAYSRELVKEARAAIDAARAAEGGAT
jgi:hypothetical protein